MSVCGFSRDQKMSAAEVNTAAKAFTDFYSLYLIHRMSPGEVVAQHPEWKALWYDAPGWSIRAPGCFLPATARSEPGKSMGKREGPCWFFMAQPIPSRANPIAARLPTL
jgi:hypothetical protein